MKNNHRMVSNARSGELGICRDCRWLKSRILDTHQGQEVFCGFFAGPLRKKVSACTGYDRVVIDNFDAQDAWALTDEDGELYFAKNGLRFFNGRYERYQYDAKAEIYKWMPTHPEIPEKPVIGFDSKPKEKTNEPGIKMDSKERTPDQH